MLNKMWSAASIAAACLWLSLASAFADTSYRPIIGINVDVAAEENTACLLGDQSWRKTGAVKERQCEPISAGENGSGDSDGQQADRLHLEKPLSYSILSNYVEAVKKAGGLPVLIPPVSESDLAELAPRLDGLLMIGGDDYPPASYGEKKEDQTVLMADARWRFDLALVKMARKMNLPYLGICAGSQALNIACGGTLIQDIPSHFPQSKIAHASKNGWQSGFNRHLVMLEPGSRLASILGDKLDVVTSHHQCVGQPGVGLKIAARSQDGLPEAVEAEEAVKLVNGKASGAANNEPFCVGVQWHPERDFPANKALFEKFVAAAADYHKGRTR